MNFKNYKKISKVFVFVIATVIYSQNVFGGFEIGLSPNEDRAKLLKAARKDVNKTHRRIRKDEEAIKEDKKKIKKAKVEGNTAKKRKAEADLNHDKKRLKKDKNDLKKKQKKRDKVKKEPRMKWDVKWD